MYYLLPFLFLPTLPMQLANPVPEETVVLAEAPHLELCPSGHTCVLDEDMKVFLQLLKDQQCRSKNLPEIKADPINIVVDRQGRIFNSGTGGHPHKIHMDWCNYEIDAEANVKLQVAKRVEPTWGFRLRPKATLGILARDALESDKLHNALDGGILLDPFFYQWVNLNVMVGVRSFGVGIGADATTNFGGYLGYAMTWGEWRSNPYVGIYFAF